MPRRLTEFPPCIKDSLCVWEFLRGLGFKAEDIYLNANTIPQLGHYRTSMLVREEGKEDFALGTGYFNGTKEKLLDLWMEAGDLWNKTSDVERDSIWRFSRIARDRAARRITVERLQKIGRLAQDFTYDEENFDRCWIPRAS